MSPSAAISKGRSKITNTPTKLAGVDNRSSFGRRRRDLIRGYIAALGGPDKVSSAVMLDITRAVDLVVLAEQCRSAALRGEPIDMSDLIRLEGAADRAVRRLGIKEAKPAVPSIQDHIARKYAKANEAQVDDDSDEAETAV